MKKSQLLLRFVVLLFAVLALSQTPKQDQPFRIVAKFSEVAMPVTIVDAAGDFVDNVERKEVILTDKGAVQKVDQWDISFRPISLVILANTSTRMKGVISNVRSSGVLFTQLVLGETGEGAVITYDNTVDVRQPFTTNGDLIEKSLKSLECEAGGSRLTDGVLRGIGMLSNRAEGRRRVLVILGEGRDFGSDSGRQQALVQAQLANVSIYAVELSAFKSLWKRPSPMDAPQGVPIEPEATRPQVPGVPLGANGGVSGFDPLTPMIESAFAIRGLWVHPMKTYAVGTGSNHINATSSKAIEEAVQKIGLELHSQYWLSYKPNNLDAPEFHKVEIKVERAGLKVHARPGYLYIP